MVSKKICTLYILIIMLTPLLLYYAVAGEIPTNRRATSGSLGFVSLFSGFVLVYAIYIIRKRYFSKKITFDEINTDRSKESYSVEKRSKKSRALNIFSSEED